MPTRGVRVGPVTIGGGAPLALIAGPCVIESRDAALRHAERLKALAARAGVWSTSTTDATASTWSFSCTSVSTGSPVSRRTSARIASPSSMPTPRNDPIAVRLALSNDDL